MVLCSCQPSLFPDPRPPNVLHERRLSALALKEGKEAFGKGEVAEIVGREFILNHVEIHRLGLREIESALDAGVDQDAIKIFVRLRNATRP